LRAFAYLPGCGISLRITYRFPDQRASFPLGFFQALANGTHTLHNEVVPPNEAAIRECLDQSNLILPFDLFIDYASHNDVKPRALVAVKYCPPYTSAFSASTTSSTKEILACDFHPEEMEVAYLRASEASRDAAADDRV
jgi:hypothetical protein